MRRSAKTITGNAGIIAIQCYCHEHALIFLAEPREDYGVDCYIEVCEGGSDADGYGTPLNFVVAVQSKAGPSYRNDLAKQPGKFRIYVKQEHIEYWSISNIPVVFTFLDGDGTLYWKHIQSYFQEGRDEKYIDFTAEDRAGSSLASYLRTLQAKTPNVSHRLKLVRNKEPVLVVNGVRINLSPEGLMESGAPLSPELTSRVTNRGSEERPTWSTDLESCILGMSSDGRWIGYILATQQGGRGTSYDFRLLDRENWAEAHYSILLIGEQDGEMLPVTSQEMTARLTEIASISTSFGLSPVRIVETDGGSDHKSDRTTLDLDFQGLIFSFATEGTLTRSFLHLECDQFVPVRRFRVLAVNNSPRDVAVDEIAEGEYIGLTIVKTFRRVRTVFVSSCGKFISLMIVSNAENSCWGSEGFTFVHSTVEELRRACLDCISR